MKNYGSRLKKLEKMINEILNIKDVFVIRLTISRSEDKIYFV